MKEDIVVDGQIRFGAPCIKGTRVSVSDILGYIAGGDTVETILENFPELTKKNIYDAVSYASHVLNIGAKVPPLHEATVG
jgi:uncharacterized protein (DUF433 family)